MKNFIKNVIVLILIILIYINRPEIVNSVINSLNLSIKSIIPSIFPIMIISDLIISTNLIELISNILGPLFNKLFKVSKYSSYVFIMSTLTGCPSNAKYINDLLNQNVITNNEASKILSFSCLYNPLLIISITSYLPLNDSIYLIISNIIINLIIGLINRNYKCNILNNNIKIKSFNLINSISYTINVLLLIIGSITTFNIINTINPIKHPLITGILEITNGINMISYYNINYQYQLIFIGILLSFGGLSILFQIKSIFKNTFIDYSLYYKSRIIHLILMLLNIYLIYPIINP